MDYKNLTPATVTIEEAYKGLDFYKELYTIGGGQFREEAIKGMAFYKTVLSYVHNVQVNYSSL